jgi:hypothetical protein
MSTVARGGCASTSYATPSGAMIGRQGLRKPSRSVSDASLAHDALRFSSAYAHAQQRTFQSAAIRRHAHTSAAPMRAQPPAQPQKPKRPAQAALAPRPVKPPLIRDVPTTTAGTGVLKYMQPGKLLEFRHNDDNILGLVVKRLGSDDEKRVSVAQARVVDVYGTKYDIKATQIVVVLPGKDYDTQELKVMEKAVRLHDLMPSHVGSVCLAPCCVGRVHYHNGRLAAGRMWLRAVLAAHRNPSTPWRHGLR